MRTLAISDITTQFMQAEMEYLQIVGLTVDFEHKGTKDISPEEIHAVREAKQKRDRLEAHMLAAWEEASQEMEGGE